MGDSATVPFSKYRTRVREEWLDYNGHMHDASYGIVLSEANEQLFAELGLSADYRHSTGASLYTVQCHVRYLAECLLGQVLRASTRIVAADPKRVRLYTELLHEDGGAAATGEHLYLHVDAVRGGVTAMPVDRQERIQQMLTDQAALEPPGGLCDELGKSLGARPVARPGEQ